MNVATPRLCGGCGGSWAQDPRGGMVVEKQEWFVRLIVQGVSNSEACRIVGSTATGHVALGAQPQHAASRALSTVVRFVKDLPHDLHDSGPARVVFGLVVAGWLGGARCAACWCAVSSSAAASCRICIAVAGRRSGRAPSGLDRAALRGVHAQPAAVLFGSSQRASWASSCGQHGGHVRQLGDDLGGVSGIDQVTGGRAVRWLVGA